ncbi:MAG: hypothetical protein RMI90_13705, partial [Thermoguttaceae bacterium]|nr:hypothetical protein [Thermoguttaceae bacterium]
QQAYLAGIDRIPWPCRVEWNQGELVIERHVSDSANLYIPWPVEGVGVLMLSTATLMEREEPYHLPLELARGKLAQVRNQLGEWEVVGLVAPEELRRLISEATRQLAEAVLEPPGSEQSTRAAEQALRLAVEAADRLASCYAEQVLAVRRRGGSKLPTWVGVELDNAFLDEGTGGHLLPAISAACVPIVWHDVEAREGTYQWEVADELIGWCRKNQLFTITGPLLQLNRRSLPDWTYLCEDDAEAFGAFAQEFVQAAVRRYRGQVQLWIAASRINVPAHLSLSEEERIRLTAQVIQWIRSADPQTPVVVGFDQPWAEYLAQREMDFPPLHVADTLLRADLGLHGLLLEMNLGYQPGGTFYRDLLEISRQLDHWAMLGAPLYISFCAASSDQPDPLAHYGNRRPPPGTSPRSQQLWISRLVPLLLAKPYIQGILWNHLRDYLPHDYPHAGLFDLRRQPKPALRTLAALRHAFLK